MGKRMNGVMVLITAILDLLMGIAWYAVLFPSKPEEATIMVSTLFGALVMLMTLMALFLNYVVYGEAIKDD